MYVRHQIDRASYLAARDYQRADARARRQIKAHLAQRYGDDGVAILRDVARDHGDGDRQGLRFWGGLFRRCLKALAVVLGYPRRTPMPAGAPYETAPRRRTARVRSTPKAAMKLILWSGLPRSRWATTRRPHCKKDRRTLAAQAGCNPFPCALGRDRLSIDQIGA